MNNSFWSTIKSIFIRFFPYVAIFSASLYNPGDSDMGWHLKYVEYFITHLTPLTTNIYSTMMNGYKWVNSSWATDVITYTTFYHFGFYGLTILGAIIITAIFYFLSKTAKLSFFEQAIIFPIILNLEEPLFSVSFRGHLISLLFISILIFLLKKYENGQKKFLLITLPVFILWSNIHGEFILGLCIFTLWVIFFFTRKLIINNWSIKFQKENISTKLKSVFLNDWKYLFILPILSFLFAMINPFTICVYLETLRHFANPLQKYIVEWLPLDPYTPAWYKLIIWGIIIVGITIYLKAKRLLHKNLTMVGITLILLLLSFWMRRYAWAMFLVSVPVIKILVENFKPKSEKTAQFIAGLFLVTFYIYNVYAKIPTLGIAGMNWENYCKWYVYCSEKSAEFIINNPLSGKLLTFYNWGGWLIWKYPLLKPSIDGRMHLWRDEKGYSAFAEYYGYEQNWTDVDKSDYDGVYINLTKPLYFQMVKLTESKKWKMVYKDDFAAVFYRIKKI